MHDHYHPSHLKHVSQKLTPGNCWSNTISAEEFSQAVAEIRQWSGYAPTDLHRLPALAASLGIGEVFYKDESTRFGLGSFKALGGAYAAACILREQISARLDDTVTLEDIRTGRHADLAETITLVSATDGNHGRSLAWGCQNFGAKCRIYIHREVSEGRARSISQYGAEVIRVEGDYDDSVRIARQEADQNGWFVVSDTSWPGYSEPPTKVMAGYSVITEEINAVLTAAPTHVFLQGGVGGLAASVAAGLRQSWGEQSPRVVIVEPDLAACLFESAKADKPTSVQIEHETMMAGLSCGQPSPLAWGILAELASDFLTIEDGMVAPTMRLLARPASNDPQIEAGESAVAGLAALIAVSKDEKLRSQLNIDPGSRVLLIGSEGATDRAIYDEIMMESEMA